MRHNFSNFSYINQETKGINGGYFGFRKVKSIVSKKTLSGAYFPHWAYFLKEKE